MMIFNTHSTTTWNGSVPVWLLSFREVKRSSVTDNKQLYKNHKPFLVFTTRHPHARHPLGTLLSRARTLENTSNSLNAICPQPHTSASKTQWNLKELGVPLLIGFRVSARSSRPFPVPLLIGFRIRARSSSPLPVPLFIGFRISAM